MLEAEQLLDFVRVYQSRLLPFDDGTLRRIPYYDSRHNEIVMTLDRREADGWKTAERRLPIGDMNGGAREVIDYIDRNLSLLKEELDEAPLRPTRSVFEIRS